MLHPPRWIYQHMYGTQILYSRIVVIICHLSNIDCFTNEVEYTMWYYMTDVVGPCIG